MVWQDNLSTLFALGFMILPLAPMTMENIKLFNTGPKTNTTQIIANTTPKYSKPLSYQHPVDLTHEIQHRWESCISR